MLAAFLLFGTAWFWVALVVPAILLIWLIEVEKAGAALATVVITIGLFVLFGDKNLVPWVLANPGKIAMYIGGYIVVGILWGVLKWVLHVLRARDKYETIRKDFLSNEKDFRTATRTQSAERAYNDRHSGGVHNQERKQREKEEREAAVAKALAEPVPQGFDKELFKEFARRHHSDVNLTKFPPHPNDNKGRIIFWMSYWPFSAVWTIINDPITRFYRFVYHRIGDMLAGISNRMFSKYKNDLA